MKKLLRVSVALVTAVLLMLALAGCGKPSIEGEWVAYTPAWEYRLSVDDEWMHIKMVRESDQAVGDYRYTITGDSSLKVEGDGKSDNWGYSISDDTLTLSNSSVLKPFADTWLKVGSPAYEDAKAEWDKKQAEEKAKDEAADAEEKATEEKSACWQLQALLGQRVYSYSDGLRSGVLADGAYRQDGTSQADWDKIVQKVRADLADAKTSDDVVQTLLEVGNRSDGYNEAFWFADRSEFKPEDWKCPSGGTITVVGWMDDQVRPKFKCSIHGEEY